jgi:hypothetical protein
MKMDLDKLEALEKEAIASESAMNRFLVTLYRDAGELISAARERDALRHEVAALREMAKEAAARTEPKCLCNTPYADCPEHGDRQP